jgi:nucleoside triphosphate diphosphatase
MAQNPADMDMRSLATLKAIMAALRTPVTGCPWDLEQSFETIAPYTIEEAYEVADAIQSGDRKHLCEELGDLLLQPIYHAQLAAEEGAFTLEDVIEGVNRKMISRHPHVFGDDEARSAGVAKGFWEANKAKERAAKGEAQKRVLDGIPLALPGLTRAVKLQSKAAKVGFDWPHVEHVYDKLAEEVEELKQAPADERAGELGSPIWRGIMASIPRQRCAVQMPSLSGASGLLRTGWRRLGSQHASLISRRWMPCGMRRKCGGCKLA